MVTGEGLVTTTLPLAGARGLWSLGWAVEDRRPGSQPLLCGSKLGTVQATDPEGLAPPHGPAGLPLGPPTADGKQLILDRLCPRAWSSVSFVDMTLRKATRPCFHTPPLLGVSLSEARSAHVCH